MGLHLPRGTTVDPQHVTEKETRQLTGKMHGKEKKSGLRREPGNALEEATTVKQFV